MQSLREELDLAVAEEEREEQEEGPSRLQLCLRVLSAIAILCLVVLLVLVAAGPGTNMRNAMLDAYGAAEPLRVTVDHPVAGPVGGSSVPPLDSWVSSSRTSAHSSSVGLFPSAHLSVVFNVYLHRDEAWWRPMVEAQLRELHEFNLTRAASLSLHVVLGVNTSGLFDEDAEIKLNKGAEVVLSIHPAARIYRVRGNRHEYAGLALLWSLVHESGQSERPAHISADNHLLLYMHTKGMVYRWHAGEKEASRSFWNVRLMQIVVRPWAEIVQRFLTDDKCHKAGWCSGGSGWMWSEQKIYKYKEEQGEEDGRDGREGKD